MYKGANLRDSDRKMCKVKCVNFHCYYPPDSRLRGSRRDDWRGKQINPDVTPLTPNHAPSAEVGDHLEVEICMSF